METPYSVPQEILSQLGGKQFIAMTGSKLYKDGENTLVIKPKGSTKVNHVTITLNEIDLYTVTFSKYTLNHKTGLVNMKTVYTPERVYNEDLQDLFEEITGLYVTLNPRS